MTHERAFVQTEVTEKLGLQDEQSQGQVDTEKLGQPQQETSQVSDDELRKIVNDLRATNERLLNENQKHKAKTREAEERRLTAEGKKDELIEMLRGENRELQEEKENSQIASAIAVEAQQRGCARWDHLYTLTGGEGIRYDAETGTVHGVKEFFDRCEIDPEYKYLFGTREPVQTSNITPSTPEAGINGVKSKDDAIEYLRKMRKEGRYNEGVKNLQAKGFFQ
jgi:hypothetical protein